MPVSVSSLTGTQDRELILQMIQDGPGAHKLNTVAVSVPPHNLPFDITGSVDRGKTGDFDPIGYRHCFKGILS